MCGIFGIVGEPSRDQCLSEMRRMGDCIAHRGPDDAGYWGEPGIGLGMRRLSIIDISHGAQPMWIGDELGIVFNGEIYNYRELRTSLISSGYSFKTSSDTEVLLNLLHRDGIKGIDALIGMFAFALFDKHQKKLTLVRDRIGIKPLYYACSGGKFIFCSEIKGLLKAFDGAPVLNKQSIHHYLSLRYVPAPDTMWEDIHKLEPGHLLEFDLRNSNFKISRYWELNFQSGDSLRGHDYLAEFEKKFEKAVSLRLEAADVPVGVMLSGGLDSSAIAATAVRLGKKNFHTFNVSFSQGGEYSEARYADMVSRHLGTSHHQIEVSKSDFLDFLPHYAAISDEPIADLASIPLYFVSKLARNDVKVVLSGEGSDEVLAGYDFDRLIRKVSFLNHLLGLFSGRDMKLLGRIFPGLASSSSGRYQILRFFRLHMTKVFSEKEKRQLWGAAFSYRSTDELIRSWYDRAKSPNALDQALQVYCGSWLVEDLLMKADKMSMANSIELRVPFLDHQLVEWAQSLPNSWRIGNSSEGFTTKRVLREYSKKLLPAEIVNRPKKGFPVPAYEWLKNDPDVRSLVKEKLLSSSSKVGELLIPSQVKRLFRDSKLDSRSAARVWSLWILEEWLCQRA